MSAGAYLTLEICAGIVAFAAFAATVITSIDGHRWYCALAASILTVAIVTTGYSGVQASRAVDASRHRECFTVTGVDNGQGFQHTATVYAKPHTYHAKSDDVIGAVSVGEYYCGVVEDSPSWGLTLVSVEEGSDQKMREARAVSEIGWTGDPRRITYRWDCGRCGTSSSLSTDLSDDADDTRWWCACPGCGVLSVHDQDDHRGRGTVEFDPLDQSQRDALTHLR